MKKYEPLLLLIAILFTSACDNSREPEPEVKINTPKETILDAKIEALNKAKEVNSIIEKRAEE